MHATEAVAAICLCARTPHGMPRATAHEEGPPAECGGRPPCMGAGRLGPHGPPSGGVLSRHAHRQVSSPWLPSVSVVTCHPPRPALENAVHPCDACLTSSIRALCEGPRVTEGDRDPDSDTAAYSLISGIASRCGADGPEWLADTSIFSRRVLDRCVDTIDASLRRAPSLAEMAGLVALSPSHFARKFRRTTGLSLGRFINRRRIQASLIRLQRDPAPLPRIAYELGFSSQSHFTGLFRSLTGMTPSRYRKQFRRKIG